MSISIKAAQPSPQYTTFHDWRSTSESDTVLLDSLAMIAHIQEDSSIAVLAIQDEITFTVYPTMDNLISDLEIDDDDNVTILESIDITYHKLMI